MKKSYFCQCLETLREYATWEKALYKCDIDLAPTPITKVLDSLALCMCDFDENWAYDEELELNWIVEWSFGESPYLTQERHGRVWNLTDAGILYDFLVFMNEHGWEDK